MTSVKIFVGLKNGLIFDNILFILYNITFNFVFGYKTKEDLVEW
jgi:hypothetical protein